MKNIVTLDWLKKHLNDENLIIFDCRFDLKDAEYGEKAYSKAHIPNAILINLEKDLTGEKSKHGGRHPLPDMKMFAKRMNSLGVCNETRVLIYDDGDLSGASRLWWMLKYIGKKEVFVLEGGIAAWIKHSMPMSQDANLGKSCGAPLDVKLNANMHCEMEYVKENINKDHVVIIDSREKDRYLGKIEPVDTKAGHIPSALNYFWKDNLDGINLKSKEVLEERFEDLKNYKEVIVHCGSGITGAVNVLILEELGIDSKLYAGSWSDWISYEENEIVQE